MRLDGWTDAAGGDGDEVTQAAARASLGKRRERLSGNGGRRHHDVEREKERRVPPYLWVGRASV
jgi:hypothetical protein